MDIYVIMWSMLQPTSTPPPHTHTQSCKWCNALVSRLLYQNFLQSESAYRFINCKANNSLALCLYSNLLLMTFLSGSLGNSSVLQNTIWESGIHIIVTSFPFLWLTAFFVFSHVENNHSNWGWHTPVNLIFFAFNYYCTLLSHSFYSNYTVLYLQIF
jgi:hypothetical protein